MICITLCYNPVELALILTWISNPNIVNISNEALYKQIMIIRHIHDYTSFLSYGIRFYIYIYIYNYI